MFLTFRKDIGINKKTGIKMGIQFSRTLIRSFMTIAFCLSLASCLPVKKETQCGDNEAFNASRRQCVPTVGASTSNTVFIGAKSPANSYSVSQSAAGASVHTIAVSDVYGYGFSIRWYVHEGGSTSTSPVGFTATYNFFPNLRAAGPYVIEAVVLDEDGTNQLDSVTWNVIVDGLDRPSLTSASPAAAAYSYLNTVTTAQTHSALVSSPDLVTGNYYAFLDGVQIGSGPFANGTNVTQTVVPSSMSNGLHTLEFKLYENTTSDELYDSYTWVINIIDPEFPIILPISTNTIPKLTETITIVNGVTFGAGGWSNPAGSNLTTISPAAFGLCVEFDNVDKLIPLGSPDIDVKMAVNGIDFETNAQRQGATNVYCADELDINNAQTNFNLSNPDVSESRTITVKTYQTGTNNLIEALSWNVAIRPTNIRPVISIDGANNSPGLGCSATTSVVYTGCTLTQSVNSNRDGGDNDYADASEGDSGLVASNFAINIDYDPDIQSENDYEVIFQIRPDSGGSWENIDEITTPPAVNTPTSQYTYSDCSYIDTDTSGTVPSSNKLICALRMDAFNNNGPLPSGNYTLRAFIRDANAGTGTGAPKESNTVTWGLTVLENQDTSSISIASSVAPTPTTQAFFVNGEDQTPDVVYNQSWIANALTPNTPVVGNLQENGSYIVNVLVKDTQRDDFSISARITNGVLGGTQGIVSTTIITRSDTKEYVRVQLPITIPEWVVANAANNPAAQLIVTVSDRPESFTALCTTCASASETFTISVDNVNPAPVFTDANHASGDVNMAGYNAFSGAEFLIPMDSSKYQDASLYDGDNIKWKWQIDLDPPGVATFDGYEDIPNANSTDQTVSELRWTPKNTIEDGTIVNFRLCLGDDGFGNPEDCANAVSTKVFSGVTAYSSAKILQRSDVGGASPIGNEVTSSGDDLSTWYDSSTESLYTAYTTGTKIYVEKQAFNATTRAFESIHSIDFDTEDVNAGETPVLATDLSIAGSDGTALVVSYKIAQAATGFLQYRVRRIDLTDNKFGFNYCGTYTPVDNGTHTGCSISDAFESVSGTLAGAPSSTATRNFSMTVLPGGTGSLVLRTSAGNVTYTINVPTDASTDLVGVTGDAVAATLATNIANAINSAGSGVVATDSASIYAASQEYFASVVGDVLTISGGPEFDYYNDISNISTYLGNIKIKADGTTWVLPFADGNNSLKLSIARGIGVNDIDGLNTSPVGSTSLLTSTSINNQEIHQVYDGSSYYIGTRNGVGNLNVYKVNDTTYAVSDTQTSAFTLATHDSIEDISLSLGNGNELYASAISTTAGGLRDLAMARFNKTNLAIDAQTEKVIATGFEKYVQDLDRVVVAADPDNANIAFITLTTNSTAPVDANSAFMIRVNFSAGFNFQEYNYPKINTNNIVSGSAIAATPLFTVASIGHMHGVGLINILNDFHVNLPQAAGTENGSIKPAFFSFHEADTGNKVRTSIVNSNETQVHSTDADPNNESSPGFIGNI
jgi:hypothetical protein